MIDFNCENLICPVCGESLHQQGGSLVCPVNHTYDIARQGYVNLLPVQQKHSLLPGDTSDMLAARRAFLSEGFYEPICDDVVSALRPPEGLPGKGYSILDAGCGEGYYTSRFHGEFPSARIIGADISKAAVKMAASRSKDISWITATASHLPVAGSSIDAVTAMFSLLCEEEFSRVLRHGGRVVEVTAGTNHLIELKRVVYDEVFEQHKKPKTPLGMLREISCELRSFRITPGQKQLGDLLRMTPHSKRIKAENRQRLEAMPSLDLTVEYFVRVLEKK